MLRAKLLRLARRMQRVRKQKKSAYNFGIGGTKHRGLTSAVRMSAKKDSTSKVLAHN
jgi:hypothetical protein